MHDFAAIAKRRIALDLVALSGSARPYDIERARLAGFHRHLSKPPDLEKLTASLAESEGWASDTGTGSPTLAL